jgi:RNA polymerase sigma-70 factor (ECF subfamily)
MIDPVATLRHLHNYHEIDPHFARQMLDIALEDCADRWELMPAELRQGHLNAVASDRVRKILPERIRAAEFALGIEDLHAALKPVHPDLWIPLWNVGVVGMTFAECAQRMREPEWMIRHWFYEAVISVYRSEYRSLWEDFATIDAKYRGRISALAEIHRLDPDEIAQLTLTSAWANRHRYDPEQPLANWLVTIALNKIRDMGRGQLRRQAISLNAPISDGLYPDIADYRRTPDREDVAAMRTYLANLEGKYREAVDLVKVKGLTYKQAAKKLGVKIGTLKAQVNRAMKMIAEMVRK